MTVTHRFGVRAGDADRLEGLVRATGVFSNEEAGFVPEILSDLGRDGEAGSGYRLLIAEEEGRAFGFTIWGPREDDATRHDLYWIVTAPEAARRGIAKALLRETLARAGAEGAREMFIETEDSGAYAPARAFYESCGFGLIETRKAYYPSGGGLALYHARLSGTGAVSP
jgi:ribosomal protein S18 acetylase RimI-like enzyme